MDEVDEYVRGELRWRTGEATAKKKQVKSGMSRPNSAEILR